jgi:hypothetical protein
MEIDEFKKKIVPNAKDAKAWFKAKRRTVG